MAISIRESYPDIYHRRQTSEKTTNVYQMQLPWRPGWRTLVTGHGLGGNTLTATSYLDRLRKIVQLVRRPGIFINISTNIFEKNLNNFFFYCSYPIIFLQWWLPIWSTWHFSVFYWELLKYCPSSQILWCNIREIIDFLNLIWAEISDLARQPITRYLHNIYV